jgi:putative transport protein
MTDWLVHFLQAQPFVALFGVLAAGMMLGRPAIRGISLGSVVCIMFVGLLLSVWLYTSTGVALTIPDIVKTIFFNIFIFSLGVKVGPQFFAGLKRDGLHMVAIGLIVAVLAPVLSYAFGWLFSLPPGAVAGLLAGSNNASATFGTASSALSSSVYQPPPGVSLETVTGMLSASFALCYAATQVQFVLFMKILPKLAGFDAPKAAREFEAAVRGGHAAPLPGTVEAADTIDATITVRAYRVGDGHLEGRTIGEVRRAAPGIAVEMVRRGTDWLALADATALAVGDEVVISAPLERQVRVREVLGPEVPDTEARALRPLHTADVVVGHDGAEGRSVP